MSQSPYPLKLSRLGPLSIAIILTAGCGSDSSELAEPASLDGLSAFSSAAMSKNSNDDVPMVKIDGRMRRFGKIETAGSNCSNTAESLGAGFSNVEGKDNLTSVDAHIRSESGFRVKIIQFSTYTNDAGDHLTIPESYTTPTDDENSPKTKIAFRPDGMLEASGVVNSIDGVQHTIEAVIPCRNSSPD